MDTNAAVSLITLLSSVSLITQRVVEGVKCFSSYPMWYDSTKKRVIWVATLVSSYIGMVFLCPSAYEILPGVGHYPSVFALSILASLGSSFWHDVLKIVSAYSQRI